MKTFLRLITLSILLSTILCANCPGIQIYDSSKKTCLLSKTECTDGFISSDQLNCIPQCAEGELIYEYKLKEVLQFKQCYNKCSDNLFLEFNQQTLLYSCKSSCENQYSEIDNDKQICNVCQKLQIYDEEMPQCKESCNNLTQYLQEYRDGNYLQYYCQTDCSQGFVKEENSKFCMPIQNCKGFVKNNQCVSSCDSRYFIYEKEPNKTYQICSSECNYFKHTQDQKTNLCVQKCPNGFLGNADDKSCISKEQCKEQFISYDGLICQQGCPQMTYIKVDAEGYSQCDVCQQRIQIIRKGEYFLNKCVESCPIGYIPAYAYQELCIKIEECELFSSDMQQCVHQCTYPEINIDNKCTNPCKDKPSDCISQCDENQFKQITSLGFKCVNYCQYRISSDNKLCVGECASIGEIPKGKAVKGELSYCQSCKSDEIAIYRSTNSTVSCISKNSMNLEDRISHLKDQTRHLFQNFYLQNQYANSLKDIIGLIVTNNNTQDQINYFQQLFKVASFLHYAKSVFQQTTTISDEKNDFILKIETTQEGNQLRKVFDIAQYRKDPKYSIKQKAFSTDGESTTFFSTLSIKNPFCHREDCKFSIIFFTAVNDLRNGEETLRILSEIQSTEQPYQAIFSIDGSISNLEKLICVSYDNSGQMFTNLQWTQFNQEKTTVTCSYSSNTALYIDSTCLFIDKANCKEIIKEGENNEKVEEVDVDDDDTNELSGGQIAGIVIGSVAGALFIGFVIVKIILSKIQIKKTSNFKEQPQVMNTEQNKFV